MRKLQKHFTQLLANIDDNPDTLLEKIRPYASQIIHIGELQQRKHDREEMKRCFKILYEGMERE